VLVEIGGTVGDIEGLPFFEAIRQLSNELPRGQTIYIHFTLLPFIPTAGELKTKPTQHSVKELRSIGIAARHSSRARRPFDTEVNERRKLALFCNVRESAVIQALDVAQHLRRADAPTTCRRARQAKCWQPSASPLCAEPDLDALADGGADRIHNPEGEVKIAIVGKYTGLKDAYKSLIEALAHGGIANRVRVKLEWIESEIFEKEDPAPYLEKVHGISRARRLRRTRLGGQDQGRQIRPHPQRAVFRHLLRHADGLYRGGALAGGIDQCVLDRVRRDQGAGRRH
jgi:CTP synthase